MGLFGTNGVRGKIDVLHPMLAFKLSWAFSKTIPQGKVILAKDMRITSPMLHSASLSGLLFAGRDVLDLGLCSSPVAEFILQKSGQSGLIIVTASHNPPEWNALKFIDSKGISISKERGQQIEKLVFEFENLKQANKVGKVFEEKDATKKHTNAVLESVNVEKIKQRKFRAVLDFGNGTSVLSKELFEKLGIEIIPLNEKLDGTFPGRLSEPTEANLKDLCKKVKEFSADFGVAWDGDSDRVIFVDEKGNFVVGDKGFAISCKEACKSSTTKEKIIVTTVATSRCVEDIGNEFGAKTIYTKVGAPYLSEKVVEYGQKVVCAGEEVGGIIWPKFSVAKDGIYAAAKMAEILSESTLSEQVASLPIYFNTKSKVEKVNEQNKEKGLHIIKEYAEKSGGKLTLIDGVRVDFEEGWVIVRASGTEDAMRIFSEAKTKNKAEELLKEYKEVLEQGLNK